jgi:hypothetical protein
MNIGRLWTDEARQSDGLAIEGVSRALVFSQQQLCCTAKSKLIRILQIEQHKNSPVPAF